jgi:hypothetical protein
MELCRFGGFSGVPFKNYVAIINIYNSSTADAVPLPFEGRLVRAPWK